jgi:acetyltransferase-like isoleucine patch superfamily enzyme
MPVYPGALASLVFLALRDVPDGRVVVGNPAWVIKDIEDIPAYSIL